MVSRASMGLKSEYSEFSRATAIFPNFALDNSGNSAARG